MPRTIDSFSDDPGFLTIRPTNDAKLIDEKILKAALTPA